MKRQTRNDSVIPEKRIIAVAAQRPPNEYAEVGSHRRRASRHAVYKDAVAVLPRGEKLPVVIRNTTPKGCRIEYFQNRWLEGRLLLIERTIPLRLWADVVWSESGVCGLTFVEHCDD